jgi:hypothetical protein
MVGDPRDKTAYSVAIASLGFSLLVVVVAICWVGAQSADPAQVVVHRCGLHALLDCKPEVAFTAATLPQIPNELWSMLLGFSGVLVGALIPFPPQGTPAAYWRTKFRIWSAITAISCIALAAAALLLAQGAGDGPSAQYLTGGFLLGLLIPTPARGD